MRDKRSRWFTAEQVSDVLAKDRRWVGTEGALHCAECPTIFEPGGDCHCPRCGSAQSWRLALVMERRAG